jgi:hypothetical protein
MMRMLNLEPQFLLSCNVMIIIYNKIMEVKIISYVKLVLSFWNFEI